MVDSDVTSTWYKSIENPVTAALIESYRGDLAMIESPLNDLIWESYSVTHIKDTQRFHGRGAARCCRNGP